MKEVVETTKIAFAPFIPKEPASRSYGRGLDLEANTVGELLEQLGNGLPTESFGRLQALLGVSQRALAGYLGLSEATLHRRFAEGRFKAEESERLYRYLRKFHAFDQQRFVMLRWRQVVPVAPPRYEPHFDEHGRDIRVDRNAERSRRSCDGYTDHEPLFSPHRNGGAGDDHPHEQGRAAMGQMPSLARDDGFSWGSEHTQEKPDLGELLSSKRLSSLDEVDGAQWS